MVDLWHSVTDKGGCVTHMMTYKYILSLISKRRTHYLAALVKESIRTKVLSREFKVKLLKQVKLHPI